MPGTIVAQNSIRLERPRSPRRRVCIKATFKTVGARGAVPVRNISCTGMLIEGDGLPAAGKDILLTAAGFELFGTVVWNDGSRCGIAFDEPLAPAKVLALHRITPEQVRTEELNAAAEWYRLHYCCSL